MEFKNFYLIIIILHVLITIKKILKNKNSIQNFKGYNTIYMSCFFF